MPQDPYVYPGTGVLRNNLEIRDPQELSRTEADIAGEARHRIAWEHLDHERSFAANVASLNGQNEPLRVLLERARRRQTPAAASEARGDHIYYSDCAS